MSYNEELTSYLENVDFNNQSVYDIGANEGEILEFINNHSLNTSLHGIEPHPNNISILNQKFKDNNNITITHGAINTFDGECYIGFEKQQRKNGLQQGHVMNNNVNDLQGRKWIEGCNVKSFKLDTFCKDATIIKMDIEGFEHKILHKSLNKLNNTKTWLLEIHSWEDIDLHGWDRYNHNSESDSLNKMIKLFLKNGFNEFILAKKRNINNVINENTYWSHIPVSSYIQDNKRVYYKVVNLIIQKKI
tara:strand:- start:164 stop:904 length:741 start_codon:yes stop_codon:yes gene_type:complete